MTFNQRTLLLARSALMLLCVLFAALTLYELLRQYRLPPIPEPRARTPSTHREAARRTLPPLSEFSQIIERPLFTESRQSFTPPPATPKKRQRPERDDFGKILLSAVVITDDEGLALLYTDRDPKLQKRKQGQNFKGWTLTNIRADSVSLSKNKRTKLVKLVVAPSRPDPAPENQRKEQQPPPETNEQ